MLTGETLLPEQKAQLEASRVVHATIDPTIAAEGAAQAEEEEEGAESGENDPDRIIVNARAAQPSDGLLTDQELEQLYRQSGTPTSVYDAGLRTVPGISDSGLTYGSRGTIPGDRRGSFEPCYTSYTHVRAHAHLQRKRTVADGPSVSGRQYWKSVLGTIVDVEPAAAVIRFD